MIRLYCAATLQEAHLLLGLLSADGIRARLQNAHAQSALGEIPFTHAYPEVWIERPGDIERARALIAAYETAGAAAQVRCRQCGEDNPANFDTCWNCGLDLASGGV